jgi:hypothetical protein
VIVRMRIQLIQLQEHSAHTGHSQRSAGGEVPALQATLVRLQPHRERRAFAAFALAGPSLRVHSRQAATVGDDVTSRRAGAAGRPAGGRAAAVGEPDGRSAALRWAWLSRAPCSQVHWWAAATTSAARNALPLAIWRRQPPRYKSL